MELGVYQGGSAWALARLAEKQSRKIYLYDTFEGIPFKGEFDSHAVGDFGDTSAEAVKKAIPYAEVIKGVFPDSLVEMPEIAFAHIDADQYQSIKDAIEILGPKMVQGGVMWFDDVDCLPGALRAFEESGLIRSNSHGKYMVRF